MAIKSTRTKKPKLTPVERQLLRAITLTGGSTAQLSKLLGVSERMVKYHTTSLHKALGVDSKIELSSFILNKVIERLAEAEGVKWPKKRTAQAKASMNFLHALFESEEHDPVGLAFADEVDTKELKAKAVRRRKKHTPKGPYDWSSVDWSKPIAQIAEELGCSKAMAYRKFHRLFDGPRGRATPSKAKRAKAKKHGASVEDGTLVIRGKAA